MPELNRISLSEEFDIENLENQVIDFPISNEGEDDPDIIIKENIERANRILDQVEEELTNGNFSARLVEVAAKVLDSVTNAASQIQSTSYNNDYLQLKERMLLLKKSELDYKVKNLRRPNVANQNIIFTDRESILKALRNNTKILGEGDEEGYG